MTIFPIMFLCGTICFWSAMITLMFQYKHLLSMLLSLEAMMLSLFIMLCSSSTISLETFFVLMLITLGACEASLGLSILVALIRTHGNDYVFNFNLMKC
uniref:NADH-ubiquinone oxidoreductase chain 4L n=1 Tax=Solemya velum TaxID=13268 RepID=H9TB04_SOLVE|nr:NADH dehydrogenase subunit 4L [Solemya velum]AFG18168.1 NADH dehydrogenase subunit 4L [Solemya velum]AGI98157.1 NADH dehydrogenase subunit 4L [Solemya velum]